MHGVYELFVYRLKLKRDSTFVLVRTRTGFDYARRSTSAPLSVLRTVDKKKL